MKNYKMANKGKGFEIEIEYANANYKNKGIANIQKISTPWKVIRQGNKIVSAYPEGKSTVDFRGAIIGGRSVAFDAKESEELKGLPLSHIQPHQIEFLRFANKIGEIAFILCYMKRIDKRFLIPSVIVIDAYDYWRANPRKRGINFISVDEMTEVKRTQGIALDYLKGLY